MVRGGKVGGKRNFRKRDRSKEGVSDDSDEDYVVSDEDRDLSDGSEDSLYSLDGCESEESLDSFVGDEDEEIEVRRKFNRSKTKNGICGRQKIGRKPSQHRGRITYSHQLEEEKEEDKEEEEREQEEVDDEETDEYEEDDADEDFDCDDDEEFTAEEEDYSDEEEIKGRKKKSDGIKMGKKVVQKRASVAYTRGRKRRKNSRAAKPLRKKRRKNGGLRRKTKYDDEGDFVDNGPAIRTKSKKKTGRKRRRLIIDSDSHSDCVSSRSSEYEYTISEEEREQVREAEELCGSLRTNLRSSSLLTKNEEDGLHEDLHQQRKPPARKGKEKIEEHQGRKGKDKVEDLKSEPGKQVCGICLSEEDKRRVRGVLDCCTHFFCFACIMEWAKVESRCPLCKQRFKTISKPARSTTAGVDLRGSVIQVPERDQVYQPSEEELRSYIDPYEYVICSECHQGGDDDLMLLCDLCDSPAHTYCVGLGREVPEGNWYCDGCRPVAMGSSSSQVQEGAADSRATTVQSLPGRPSPAVHAREVIDLNLMSSPRAAFSQGFGNLSSRFSGRSVEGASPVSGGGAPTLSERRWIHRQIQQLLSMDRMTSSTGRSNGISATNSTSNLYGPQSDQSRVTTTHDARTQNVGTSYHSFFEERLCHSTSPLMQNGDHFSMRVSNSRRPAVQDSAPFTNRTVNGGFWPGLVVTHPVSDYEQGHQLSSSSHIVADGSMSPAIREESNFHIVKEQLSSLVKRHLMGLSQNIDLGNSTIKDIARISLNTILAACGLEHKKSEEAWLRGSWTQECRSGCDLAFRHYLLHRFQRHTFFVSS
ncbi:uncharacterized protein LOC129288104 isoform X2 [Prosopis cineraria]|uniref:uncharacterized protein LOC129288104 isoform X2 n=1 Tax=Prosopis cineraria TaxID=364024 RepID=UPI0024104BE3|nr:uncharacterized protein LOC129288104 isoform X2 [Prosopis cineraria]